MLCCFALLCCFGIPGLSELDFIADHFDIEGEILTGITLLSFG